ncbi:DNA (cytosine-5)-methyltransferase 3A [Frankliniella fusca]|uniref:DNA (Cytosine-5)-methyltransferase 3A n=1 Tax=Frankliniella fusca TaxID=407009 RepID=A0AAE1HMV1_9NEOP|nr:DNA (cytosine-5)-methyltransferase 3A [Frankliniella fusca]
MDVRVHLSSSRHTSGIRVLSLFDGIGTGLYALQQLGIEVADYFSSEVDGNAISVLKSNYHGIITMLGPVAKVTSEVLQCLGGVDLLLGK